MTNIQKTEAFLKAQFDNCVFFQEHPADGEYRLQHSYRVAHAAREIARKEGLDEEGLIIGGLLHDVGYSLPFEGRRNAGRSMDGYPPGSQDPSWNSSVWAENACRRSAMALRSM